jgi:serine phosphatase RsbU (regulator of sigma subunit)
VQYFPAGGSTPVGGDWYESLRLDNDRVAFVVGDVAGHGVAAAADMALARGMITALLHSGAAVADVFSEVTAVLSQSKALVLASAVLVVVDEAAETMTFATAGHPPPLILDRGGHVRALNTANSPLIGLDETLFAGTYRLADTAPFPCGSQLVLYTDGLVERRDRSFASGVETMAMRLAGIPTHLRPAELIDAVLAKLIGTRTPTDDIAILVVEQLSRSL